MLDRATGELVFDDGERIGPATTRAQFLAQALGRRAEAAHSWTADGASWSPYRIRGCVSEGRRWGIGPKFRDEALFSIDLWDDGPDDGKGWDSWSLDAEQAHVRDYQAVIERWVGSARRFAWGWVSAGFDARGGGAYFIVRYTLENDGAPAVASTLL